MHNFITKGCFISVVCLMRQETKSLSFSSIDIKLLVAFCFLLSSLVSSLLPSYFIHLGVICDELLFFASAL